MTRLQKLSRAIYALIDSNLFAKEEKQFLLEQLGAGMHDVIKLSITVSTTSDEINTAIEKLRENGEEELENIFLLTHKNLKSYRSQIIHEYYYVEFIEAILSMKSYDEVEMLDEILNSIGVTIELTREVKREYNLELNSAEKSVG